MNHFLIIVTTFSPCFVVTGSWKGTTTKQESKLIKPQNLRVYEIYNPQALSSALASLGRHSPGPSGYKFRRPLGFEV